MSCRSFPPPTVDFSPHPLLFPGGPLGLGLGLGVDAHALYPYLLHPLSAPPTFPTFPMGSLMPGSLFDAMGAESPLKRQGGPSPMAPKRAKVEAHPLSPFGGGLTVPQQSHGSHSPIPTHCLGRGPLPSAAPPVFFAAVHADRGQCPPLRQPPGPATALALSPTPASSLSTLASICDAMSTSKHP